MADQPQSDVTTSLVPNPHPSSTGLVSGDAPSSVSPSSDLPATGHDASVLIPSDVVSGVDPGAEAVCDRSIPKPSATRTSRIWLCFRLASPCVICLTARYYPTTQSPSLSSPSLSLDSLFLYLAGYPLSGCLARKLAPYPPAPPLLVPCVSLHELSLRCIPSTVATVVASHSPCSFHLYPAPALAVPHPSSSV
ncbi:hypothetical protein CROQUDRAFT_86783 [Cronartium quercuum f. sp. fusiforme G11]|uniref:Uncharacterized protein n=1 Tax=Cronartium quercuum f. sp. fusiforme G11 TaxID=708437 RepID=A0A9P6TH32_9BASI|nr:hypothetical protein CROQUDRAFT_86783 [Cronartium quercuum f. sp. fusiforme G11]